MNSKPKIKSDISSYELFQEDSMSLGDILLNLAEQIKLIFIVPTIVCSLTIVYVQFFATPEYTSTSKIMSSSGGSSSTNAQASGLAAQFGINIPNMGSEPVWVYPEIIQSRTLARKILKKRFDTNEFGQQKTLLQILTYGNEDPSYGIDTLIIIAIENFLGMIEVFEDSKTGIFTLSINASEPTFASDLNMALIQELDTHQRNYNKTKTTDTKTFIEERIVTTERDLMSAEENLKVFRDRNRRIENSPSLQLEEQRLRREVAVLTGVFTTLKQQLETTKIQEYKDLDYVIIIDPPEVSLYPSKPKKRRSVILAGLIGIFFGVLLALFKKSLINKNKEEKIKMSKAKFLFVQNISDLIPKRFK